MIAKRPRLPAVFSTTVLALFLTACGGSPIKPTEQTLANLAGRPLTITHYRETPDFQAETFGNRLLKMEFPIVGNAPALSLGDQLIQDNGVADPADAISRRLAEIYRDRYRVNSPSRTVDLDTYTISALPANVAQDGVVLDVKTTGWGAAYIAMDITHYYVMYAARARLVDAVTHQEVARASCWFKRADMPDPLPTYEELFENRAAGLKAKLDDEAARCAASLAQNMLGGAAAAPTGQQAVLPEPVPPAPVARPAVVSAPPQPVVARPAPAAPALQLDPHQKIKFSEFLTKPLPRAFAISSNGHSAAVWGPSTDPQGRPVDLRQRVLEGCRQAAGQDCVLYAIDDTVLFTGTDAGVE